MTFDTQNKEVALKRIQRLAVSGLPLEPFVMTLFQLVNDGVPYSPLKTFAAGDSQNWICNSPDLYKRVPVANQTFFDYGVNSSKAGLRVPLNFKSFAVIFPTRKIVREEEMLVLPEFYRTDAFNLVTKPLGWRRATIVLLREGVELHGALPMWRTDDQQPFSKEDLCFLQACQPHLSHGLRTAQLIQERAVSSAVDFLPSSLWDTGVILMDPSGAIVAMDEPARSAFVQLGRLDGIKVDRFDHRAREVLEYVGRITLSAFRNLAVIGPAPMIRMFTHWSGAILKLRGAVAEASDGRLYVTVIVERGDTRVLRRQATMLRWGLSEREVEVLDFVRTGKTNAEIGIVLGASTLTVKKHIEHIIDKLGVETRTAAAAIAFGTP
jgi:DNA-binding CsgD family transcriptional regulator